MSIIHTKIDGFVIRRAAENDVELILNFIRELAEYEKLSKEVTATETKLRNTLFGDDPVAEVIFGEYGGEPAAFALFFRNYSTFLGKAGLYLEDLFVRPAFRNRGFGKVMLSFLAKTAIERNYARFEWSVLDWNEPALQFYRSLGAIPMDEWTIHRLTDDSLKKLASLF
jgi:GNAT superfamily N-acetyltransferase